MKTIGLLGGMSWESTVTYYQIINQEVNRRLGGLHSAKLLLNSVDFAEIEQLQMCGDWSRCAEILAQHARSLQLAGADFIVLCTNTMHIVAEHITHAVSIPLLHIADATASVLQQNQIDKIGLLGTRFTMQQPFYCERLLNKYGINTLVPEIAQMERVHDIIYHELCKGEIKASSREYYLETINSLASKGAQGIILGCTEIGLLVSQAQTDVQLYDTTSLHALAAVEQALVD